MDEVAVKLPLDAALEAECDEHGILRGCESG
jgi:hypothetical protein